VGALFVARRGGIGRRLVLRGTGGIGAEPDGPLPSPLGVAVPSLASDGVGVPPLLLAGLPAPDFRSRCW